MDTLQYKENSIKKIDLGIKEEYFGDMLQYILNDNITDIEWDGQLMKIDDLTSGERFVDTKLDENFCQKFAKRVSDKVNKSFNDSHPKLEAETDTLRITILDSTVTTSGTNINLRKIEAKVRMDNQSIIDKAYCDIKTRDLLMALVKIKCSGILTGGTGTGKTELLKYLVQWIPKLHTIVSLEDTNELKLKQIYPNKFVRACIIGRHFSWMDGIEYALRANAKWLLMAEARSEEVLKVLEIASTSCAIVTCIHSKDVRQIPDRIDNMIGAGSNGVASKENDVYTFFDYAIQINKEEVEGLPPYRYINQLCIFERKGKENIIHIIIDNGELTGTPLPNYLIKQMETKNVENPLSDFNNEVTKNEQI